MTEAAQLTQRAYWNGAAGDTWVRRQDMLDAMLEPMTTPTIAALGEVAGRSVVDIGCGAGTTTFALEQLAGPDGAALGVDISEPLIAFARERARKTNSAARFSMADAGADALAGAPYDALFSRFGVMFFEQPARAMAHLRAMLKPDGAMAFVCWRGVDENPWNAVPLEAVLALLPQRPAPPDPNAPGPAAFANPDRVRGLLADSGWKRVSMERWNGEVIVAPTVQDAADFGAGMNALRMFVGLNLNRADIVRRIAEKLGPFTGADGVVRAPAACWIVTARA